jgi:hypothetical protein
LIKWIKKDEKIKEICLYENWKSKSIKWERESEWNLCILISILFKDLENWKQIMTKYFKEILIDKN